MLEALHEMTGDILLWLVEHTDYHTAVLIKNFMGDFLSLVTGFIIATLFVVCVTKDSRLVVDEKTEHIFITRFKKNNHTRIYVTMPPDKGNHLTFVMTVALYFNMVLVRLFPIKQIQFVKRYSIYFIFWIMLFLVLLLFIVSVSVDFHIILPDGKGGTTLE